MSEEPPEAEESSRCPPIALGKRQQPVVVSFRSTRRSRIPGRVRLNVRLTPAALTHQREQWETALVSRC